eukprot:1353270-Amorphochlora_amoeboformis.AAC.1
MYEQTFREKEWFVYPSVGFAVFDDSPKRPVDPLPVEIGVYTADGSCSASPRQRISSISKGVCIYAPTNQQVAPELLSSEREVDPK